MVLKRHKIAMLAGALGGAATGGGGNTLLPMTGLGQNSNFNAWYQGQYESLDIAHGLDPGIDGGSMQNQSVPIANYDTSDWSVQSLPGGVGATGAIHYLDTVETAGVPHKYSWSNAYDGTIIVRQCTGVDQSTKISGKYITLTPQSIQDALVSTAPSTVTFQPGTGGIMPRDLKCRPVTDPGNNLASAFATKIAILASPGGVWRPLHETSVEGNLHAQNPGGGFTFPNLYYPVDGNGELGEPILTAANRNTARSSNWWVFRDGTPIEILILRANEQNRPLKLALNWNADNTYYDKVADIILNGVTVNGITFPPLNSNLYAEISVSNENWNFGYTSASQCRWEADHRGDVARCPLPGIKTAVRLCSANNGNLSLTGAATVDSVAVVTNDRILVTAQTNPVQNGVWIANTAGAWTRATDADASGEIVFGDMWFVTAGTLFANTTFTCRTKVSPIVPGTTSLSITQFMRQDRNAEKSCEIFIRFENAFNAVGKRSKLKTTVEWQHDVNVGAASVWAGIMALPDRQGGLGTVADHTNSCATAAYIGDDSTNINVQGSTSARIATYYSTSPLNTDLIIHTVAAAHKAAVNAITGQGGVPLEYSMYEFGRQDVNNDATFLDNLFLEPAGHDHLAYSLNELRRVCGTGMKAAYFVFCGRVQTGTVGNFGLLHTVDQSIANSPQATAVKETVAGNFTLFTPAAFTFTACSDVTPANTIVGYFDKGVLPEAGYALSGAGATEFYCDATMTNDRVYIRTKNNSRAQATYNLNFDQNYAYATGPTTNSKAFTITVSSAQLSDTFTAANGSAPDVSKWAVNKNMALQRPLPTNSGTVDIQGNRLRLLNATGQANQSACTQSVNNINITTNPDWIYKITNDPSSGCSMGFALGAGGAGTELIAFTDDTANGFLQIQRMSSADAQSTLASLSSWNAATLTANPWHKVHYDSALDQFSLYTAPDVAGAPGTWTLRLGPVNNSGRINATATKCGFIHNNTFGDSNPSDVGFDNFN